VHIAAKNNRVDMLQYLEKSGENFDVLNDNKETPFVAGALSGSLEATQHLFSEKHFISQEVNLIINKLKNSSNPQLKQVYDFVKKQNDARWDEYCRKISNEYKTINQLKAESKSLKNIILQKKPLSLVLSFQYSPSNPQYLSEEHLYNLTREQHINLKNHYLECKTNELNYQRILNQALDEIRREEEKEEQRKYKEAQRRREEEQRKQREAEYRAQQAHAAALEQERIARNNAAVLAQQRAQQQQMKPIPSAPEQRPTPPPAPKQSASSDHDRSVFAKKHVELFEEDFKQASANKTVNAFSKEDIGTIKKCIKDSTLSSTTIAANDGAAHIQAGLILFLDQKLAEAKQELQKLNQYRADELDTAIKTARKDIITAIKKLKTATYASLAELLGNKKDESSNVKERIIKNMSR